MEAAFAWDEGRVAVLTKMIAENFPARVIAERLGTSRDAILGKTHRMGIKAPNKVKRGPNVRPRKRKLKLEVTRVVRPTHNSKSLRVVTRIELEQYKLRCVEIVPQHVSVLDLNGCAYPYGDGPFTFCNHPKREGSSYCVPHHFLCREVPRVPIYRFAGVAA